MSNEHVKITYFQCTVCGKESEEEFGLTQHSCITHLQHQLAEAREATRKAFDWALDITDEDFNSRDEVGNNYNKVKQILWEEYKEKVK